MKKILLVFATILLSVNSFTQDTAIVKVSVLNELNNPIVGEQIIFESQESNYHTLNATDSEGTFKVKLLGGETYNIQVKTIGDVQEYNTLKIPALGKGQAYSENLLTITIYESKSFTLDNVYFDSGKSSLKTNSYTELNELYEYLSLKKDIHIQISGHTDNVGNDETNFTLSQNRASSVKYFLTNKGIDNSRIETKAFGETQPIATNETQEGRSLNRRIEVLVL